MSCLLHSAIGVLLLSLLAVQEPGQPPVKEPERKLPAILREKPLTIDPKEDELVRLMKQRYNAAVSETQAQFAKYELGIVSFEALTGPVRRLATAGVDLASDVEGRLRFLRAAREMALEAEKISQARHEAGQGSSTDLHHARYQRLDLDIQILRAERERGKGK